MFKTNRKKSNKTTWMTRKAQLSSDELKLGDESTILLTEMLKK